MAAQQGGGRTGHVRYWHKADIPTAAANVRYWTKADIAGELRNVRFTQKADITPKLTVTSRWWHDHCAAELICKSLRSLSISETPNSDGEGTFMTVQCCSLWYFTHTVECIDAIQGTAKAVRRCHHFDGKKKPVIAGH
jgi:hypothetical protein